VVGDLFSCSDRAISWYVALVLMVLFILRPSNTQSPSVREEIVFTVKKIWLRQSKLQVS